MRNLKSEIARRDEAAARRGDASAPTVATISSHMDEERAYRDRQAVDSARTAEVSASREPDLG
jgi:hypothetical protein